MLKTDIFLKDQVINYPRNVIENPLISVIMPTYCRGDSGMLMRAIISVLNQSFENFEFIIVDDGSVDSTSDVIREFQEKDNRVIHIRHDINCGLPALRVNEGLMLARGEYIAYQFDDDQWVTDALEQLLQQMNSYPHKCLVYGKSLVNFNDEVIEFGGAFNYSKLIFSNYIANNSVLHPREFAIEFGGYDPHILMRRLCDWDLWLRWAKHVPFVFADVVVSNVDAGMENSIGQTVPYDMDLFRLLHSIDRDGRLSISNLNGNELDNLDHLKELLSEEKVIQAYNLHILPFYFKNRRLLSVLGLPIRYTIPTKRKNILVTKYDYDSTIEITVNNFAAYLKEYINCVYVPELQINDNTLKDYDVVVFHRTCDGYSSEVLKKSLILKRAVCYLLDDDLLNIYQLGSEFDYMKPDTEMYNELSYQIGKADSVISFSPVISETIYNLNPRVVELSTNIKGKYLNNEEQLYNYNKTRIAFAGGGARQEEFLFLWPVLQRISKEYKDTIEFHFWGVDVSQFGQLESTIKMVPFTTSYEEYMNRLIRSPFDIMLAPLFDKFKAKQAKSPIKYLEISASGSIGLYSDVLPYKKVEDGVTGIKVNNTQKAWYKAIKIAIDMGNSERLKMNQAAKEHIKDNFLSEKNAYSFLTAIELSQFHGLTRLKRNSYRKPTIAYFCHSPYLGGAENHLLRHAQLMNKYGVQPIWCLPEDFIDIEEKNAEIAREIGLEIVYLPLRVMTEPECFELNEENVSTISNWLQSQNVSLVHSVTLMPDLSAAVKKMKIPFVSSLYQVDSRERLDDKWNGFSDVVHSDSILYVNTWSKIFDSIGKCIRSWIPNDFFSIGKKKLNGIQRFEREKVKVIISGTLQKRKGQLQAILAIGELKRIGIEVELHLFGYTNFYPDYIDKCRLVISEYNLENNVFLHGFNDKPTEYLRDTDILLCTSDNESLPQAVLEAMAAGALVVSTPAGGISEIIIDNYTGILIKDNQPKSIIEGIKRALSLDKGSYSSILHNAYTLVYEECNSDRVAYELISLYNTALNKKDLSYTVSYAKEENEFERPLQTNDVIYEEEVPGNEDKIMVPINILNNKREYHINSKHNKLSGFSFIPGTHGKPLQGIINIYIYTDHNRTDSIREISIPMDSIKDNEFKDIIFEPILNSKDKKFIIQFIFNYTQKKKRIALYEWKDKKFNNFENFQNRLHSKGKHLVSKLIYKG